MKLDRKAELLNLDWGHDVSSSEKVPMDKDHQPLPWMTYCAIEYISKFKLSELRVFEWGMGGSTLFWEKNCESVTSVDDKEQWVDFVRQRSSGKAELICHTDDKYSSAIDGLGEFDIIVVDGIKRKACAQRAITHLKPGGCIILDNSDWYWGAKQFLLSEDLIPMFYSGFGPVNQYQWCTAIFASRDFDLFDRQVSDFYVKAGLSPEVIYD